MTEIFCAGDNPNKNCPLSSPLKNSTKNLNIEYINIYKIKIFPLTCIFFNNLFNIKNIIIFPNASYICVGCLFAIAIKQSVFFP